MSQPCQSVSHRTLTADTAVSIPVPEGADLVVLWAHGDRFFADFSGIDAALPADSVDDSTIEDTPYARDVTGVAAISVIAESAVTLSASFYRGR